MCAASHVQADGVAVAADDAAAVAQLVAQLGGDDVGAAPVACSHKLPVLHVGLFAVPPIEPQPVLVLFTAAPICVAMSAWKSGGARGESTLAAPGSTVRRGRVPDVVVENDENAGTAKRVDDACVDIEGAHPLYAFHPTHTHTLLRSGVKCDWFL